MKDLEKERRERHLRQLIKESIVNVLVEMAMEQGQPGSATPPASPGPAPETNRVDPDVQNSPNATVENEEFDVDDMVDKLNLLRGSRSFKDPEVYGRLNTYFNNLTEEQKNVLDWLLTELSKIVSYSSNQNPQAAPQQQQQTQGGGAQMPPGGAPSAPGPTSGGAPPTVV